MRPLACTALALPALARVLTHGISQFRARSKKLDLQRSGALIGSAMGGMHSFAGAVEAMTTQGHRKMNPFCIPFAITNMGGALAAMDIGFMVRP